MPPVALCFSRDRQWHRRDQYAAGLERAGYRVTFDINYRPLPGRDAGERPDLFLTWNRFAFDEPIVSRFQAVGGIVVVTENGWIGKAPDGGKLFALCLDNHNGAGRWAVGGPERWARLNVGLKPWRQDGRHILVLGQRGFGPSGVGSPRDWAHAAAQRLTRLTKRPVRVRLHPGRNKEAGVPLEADLKDCWAVATWSSGAAIKAIASGVPVFHALRNWIGAPAAMPFGADLEKPFLGDRLPMFERLAWAQFDLNEIASGEPFKRLLGI